MEIVESTLQAFASVTVTVYCVELGRLLIVAVVAVNPFGPVQE